MYTGEWVNGMKQGDGQLTYPDGRVVHGIWHENRIKQIQSEESADKPAEGGEEVADLSGGTEAPSAARQRILEAEAPRPAAFFLLRPEPQDEGPRVGRVPALGHRILPFAVEAWFDG